MFSIQTKIAEMTCNEEWCYYFDSLDTPMSQEDADAFCEQVGGHLLAIESYSEYIYIKSQMPSKYW